MPTIDQHPSSTSTKLLVVGDSGAGKTGALASLCAAGYQVFVIDFDKGTEILRDYLTSPESPYVKGTHKIQPRPCDLPLAKRLIYVPVSDKMTNINGNIVCSRAEAWQQATALLVNWKYKERADGTIDWSGKEKDTTQIDFGKLVDWGPDKVLVIDSLSFAADSALYYHLSLNGRLATARTQNEVRRDIGFTQQLLRKLLTLLYDDSIKCNIIVNTHIVEVTESGYAPQGLPEGMNKQEAEDERATARGFPNAIGRALSPIIPRFFNSVLHYETRGKRQFILTQTMGSVLTKTAAPLKVKREYPIETGLADYFADVRKT
jgi:hypothetical protein